MTARCALVLGVTGNLDFAAGAVIASFVRHNPGFRGDIVVLHDGLSPGALTALARLAPQVHCVPMDRAMVLARLTRAGLRTPATLDRLGRWGAMTLAKFEMFDWLDRYDSVVWADADVLIQGPVPDLWQAGPLAWRPLPPGAADRREAVLTALAPLIHHPGLPLPNGGIVVAQSGLRAKGCDAAALYAHAAWLLDWTATSTVDEWALFLLASVQAGTAHALPDDLNHPADRPGARHARIVHAIGPDKFWNAPPLRQGFPGWMAAQDVWVAAGGAPAPAPDRLLEVHPDDPAETLVFARNRAFWQALWPVLGPAMPRGVWPDLRTERAVLRLYLTGASRHVWLDLARTANARCLRIGLGVERRKLGDAGLPGRIDAVLAQSPALRLHRHEGRRLTEWTADRALDAVPETVQTLRDVLVRAMEG